MSKRPHQVVDLLVAALIAGTSTALWGLLVPPAVALWIATLFGAMYDFSRNPWGSPRGEAYNEWIDELYERYLPYGVRGLPACSGDRRPSETTGFL